MTNSTTRFDVWRNGGRFISASLAMALVLGVFVRPVFAQGPYVGVSVGSDITRLSGSGDQDPPGAGEAVSWQLKVGTPIASHFGVELEYSRPEEITHTDSSPIGILSATSTTLVSSTAIGVIPTPIIPSFSVKTAQRNCAIGTTFWVRQSVTPRFSMSYLGGVSFFRTTREFTYQFGSGVPLAAAALLPRSTRTIEYGVGPLVGVEARIGMTDHLQLVPGLRMQTLTEGWLLRPAVGVAWEF